MRIGIGKDQAKHVDAYVNEYYKDKMTEVRKAKGLQNSNKPISFMDMLPDEEKYGYEIEQDYKGVVLVYLEIYRLWRRQEGIR